MKSYKQKFQEKLDEEISEFRQKVKAQPAQEIYEDCSRMHFYECMYDYLNTEEFKTSEYKAFLQADNTFIENLWYKSLDFEFFNIGNPIDESLVVDAYLRDCAAEPVPHCM